MKTQLLITGGDYSCKVVALYVVLLLELACGAAWPLYDLKGRSDLIGSHKNEVLVYVALG